MRLNRRHAILAVVLLCGLLPFSLLMDGVSAQNTDRLPASLSDTEFWRLVTEFSEDDGSFPSPNYVSNERAFQTVLAQLAVDRKPGSAYIGVGPEQNFTYLAALEPKIAFILDIRRQNLVLHLMYKALFEVSADRAEFLSRLFSRARPANLGGASTVEELFAGFRDLPRDPEVFAATRETVRKRLVEVHGFALTDADVATMDIILAAFLAGGPYLTYAGAYSNPNVPTRLVPTFEELMLEADIAGIHRSFVATEENFRRIKDLQTKNLIIPIVGNFSGTRALPAINQYLRDNRATVTAFYTSNVEQYLFRDGIADTFYTNTAALPYNEKSVIVRALVRDGAGALSASPAMTQVTRIEVGLFPVKDLVADHMNGELRGYLDILKRRF